MNSDGLSAPEINAEDIPAAGSPQGAEANAEGVETVTQGSPQGAGAGTEAADGRRWYVLRDLRAWNTKTPAYRILADMGLEVFTPMHWTVKVNAGGKRQRLYLPYMQDLLFVRALRADLDPVVAATDKLQYRFKRGEGQGAVMTVPDAEMSRFIAAVSADRSTVFYRPDELTPDMVGREILVSDGPLCGYRGRILKMRGSRKRRLIVELPGYVAAAVEINPQFLQLL